MWISQLRSIIQLKNYRNIQDIEKKGWGGGGGNMDILNWEKQ